MNNKYKPLIDFYVDNAQSDTDLDRAMSILVRSEISPEKVDETPKKSTSSNDVRNQKQRKHRKMLNEATKMVNEVPTNGRWEKLKEVFSLTKAASITNWGPDNFTKLIDSGSIVQVKGTTQEDRYVNVENPKIQSLMN
jgi:hypothetical protein